MPDIKLAATDGSALPHNPGHAAWAYVLADENFQPGEPVSGALGWTTNNVGELTAIREVLRATEGPIVIRSDSEYAIAMVMGLRKAKENRELIDEVKTLLKGRNVAFEHVRAHQVDGDPLNAVADEAANAAAEASAAGTMRIPCPDCGTQVTGDGGTYGCSCGRVFSGPGPEAVPAPAKKAKGRAAGLAGQARGKKAAAAKRKGGPVLVTAKFNGLCPRCDSSYQVGTTIVKHPEGWGHDDC